MTSTRIASIDRFKRMTKELQSDIKQGAIAELNAGADALVAQMKAAAPLGKTGNLRRSIIKKAGKKETRVFVTAGGKLTTVQITGRAAVYMRPVIVGGGNTKGIAKGGTHGVYYDYAMGVELGTHGHGASPFFWPSWRLRRKRIRANLARKINANIKKRSAE